MRAYVIVPARGGSKGINRKNLRRVGGVPLVARAVLASRGARCAERVVVTTDDRAIADVALAAGAEIVERPAELSGDTASSESAVLHALDELRCREAPDPDAVVLVQCTSPFVQPGDIDGAVALLDGADSAFTAAPTHAFLWRRGADGAEAVNHDARGRPRRQDRVPEYVETGAVYAMRHDGFRAARHRFFGRIALFEVPPERALEIDEPRDLEVADLIARRFEAPAAPALPDPVAAVVLDFDGVITDNRVLTMQDGSEAVLSDRSDGLAIEQLRSAGIPMVVLSKERNPVVAARCEKLRLECRQGIEDKASALKAWVDERGVDLSHVVFVGNDVNDVECLELVGCAVVVGDAHQAAREVAQIVLERPGGRGALRELAELILAPTGSK